MSGCKPRLIVMLTQNDKTVDNAYEIFEQCRNVQAEYWGFKEKPMPPEEMKKLYALMKKNGKKIFLEVVAYTEAEGLEGAKTAAECGCDVLMGTKYFDSIKCFCDEQGMKYMPFVGEITGRPSVLSGDIDSIVEQAKAYIQNGVYGIDLLGYRYTGNSAELISRIVSEIDAPVCVAGSVDSFEKLDELKVVSPHLFTVGSAFFEHKFGDGFNEQISNVLSYIEE